MKIKKITYQCECGKRAEAFSSKAARIIFEPVCLITCFLLTLGLMLIFYWLIGEALVRYELGHVQEVISNEGFWPYLYFLALMLISGCIVFSSAVEVRHSDDLKNGVMVLYGECEDCKKRVRFVKHTQVPPRPWVEIRFIDDEEYIEDDEE